MSRARYVLLALACCGGSPPHTAKPKLPAIEANVAELSWYRAVSTCAQGPFELAVDATGSKYGEDVELQLHTPRAVALDAIVLADGAEVARSHAVYDGAGTTTQKPANARCVADAHERLVIGRTGGGGGGGGGGSAVTPGTLVVPPDQATTTAQLERTTETGVAVTTVVHFHVPDGAAKHLTIKFWSIDPNDLLDVHFGVAHVIWRPNVSEAAYQAYLAAEADRARRAVVVAPPRVEAHVEAHVAVVDPEVERARVRAELERERRAAINAALEIERAHRREAFCAAHHDDRGCWGPGGYKMHAALDDKRAAKVAYCAQHAEDARCWSDADWQQRRDAWQKRVRVATTVVRPDGPPPAPRAETPPPKLSEHADWRPGYWQWAEGQWVWLAGQWRVPDADIVAEKTTIAPSAPPPPQDETATGLAPVRSAVWIAGFWQWGGNGVGWVWIEGSWQIRPEPHVEWRAPVWRVRGTVHVLVPGAWERR